jgi:predicted nucleic acid-binding protein
MHDFTIVDTSSLIVLGKIEMLHLLEKLYSNTVCTDVVSQEYGRPLPDWMTVINPDNEGSLFILSSNLGAGESSSIALALEHPGSLLILDDLNARKKAISLDLRVTGVLGLILRAKERGLVSELKPIIEKLLAHEFRLSKQIIDEILKMTGES